MPERIKPKEIIAIVVGIEKYADKDLDVHGPADDAARFVRWLLAAGRLRSSGSEHTAALVAARRFSRRF